MRLDSGERSGDSQRGSGKVAAGVLRHSHRSVGVRSWWVSGTCMKTAVSDIHSRAAPGLGGCGRLRPRCGCPRSHEESHLICSLLCWGWGFEMQTFVVIIKYSV